MVRVHTYFSYQMLYTILRSSLAHVASQAICLEPTTVTPTVRLAFVCRADAPHNPRQHGDVCESTNGSTVHV